MNNLSVMRRGLFLVSLPIFFINFSIPIQAKQLNASALEIGLLFSIFTLSLLALRPLVGYGLDRYGRKLFLVAAMLFYALAHICFSLADSMAWMYLARFTQGVGAALLLITVDTITTDLTNDEERPMQIGRNIETQTRSSIVGATIGFTLIGAMADVAWQYSFGIFAAATLTAFFYLGLKFEDTHVVSADTSEFHMTDGLKKLLVIVFVAGFANALIQPIYLIYLQDKFQLPIQSMTWAFLPAALVFAFLPSRSGKLNAKFGTLNLMILGFALSGIVYLMLPYLQSILVFVILYTLSAIGWAMAEPARKALTALLGEVDSTGRNFGTTELYAGIGATIGPPIGGYLYDNQGPDVAFVANGVLLIVTAFIAWFLLRGATRAPMT